MATKSPRNENAHRNRKIAKFGLAGIAIIGVGAGLTSAAWTDNVWFGGTATSGSIMLQGSLTGADGTWFDANAEGELVIPATVFQNLTPNDQVTRTLFLRNADDGILTLEDAEIVVDGDLFEFEGIDASGAPNNTFATVTAEDLAGVQLADATPFAFDVTLTTPNWDNDAKNSTVGNSFTIEIQAST